MTEIDQNLEKFATAVQWQDYLALHKHGSIAEAARATGRDASNISRAVALIKRKAAQQGYAPELDISHQVPDGLTLRGTSILYNAIGQVDQYWNKTKVAGRPPEETTQIPDPKRIIRTAKLYDQQRNVTQEWVTEAPELAAREKLWREFAKELAADLPRAEPVEPPYYGTDELLACYPVGDHHLGMLAWNQENQSDNYDLKIGESLLTQATDHLMAATPACDQALIAFLGDFLHYDSFDTVTPAHRNLLDADGRFPKMVRAGIRSMRYMIAAALQRHRNVRVIVELGNHDLSSSIFLMECLANIYENEPRVTIDTSPSHYHYFEWGKCLIGTHHGHEAKMEMLPGIMAVDRAEAWGRTLYRYWWTGHIHHRKAREGRDINGCSVESFRILAPPDAFGANRGHRAIRDMKAIVMHREFGESASAIVNPRMFA